MLPKQNRLKKEKDFNRVFRDGKKIKEDALFFQWAPNNLKISRFGFIVSKKISKKATMRNKIKRQLRELIRKRIAVLQKGIDGVFVTRPGLEKKGFSEIEKIVIHILSKTRLII